MTGVLKFVSLIGTLLHCSVAVGQTTSSPNYMLRSDTFGDNYRASSPSYRMLGIAGQGQVTGTLSSTRYRLAAGFVFTTRFIKVDDTFCLPIKTQQGNVVVICL